ncbi:hypothetical protein GCM10010250_56900 [Streptomyces althioticus]|nr:hypothetical protein GCM10010250_56900 [Streptomyces althioticus]
MNSISPALRWDAEEHRTPPESRFNTSATSHSARAQADNGAGTLPESGSVFELCDR